MRPFLLVCIACYQKTFSPDHGWLRALYPNGCCRYYPSCSAYAAQAIAAHGSCRGLWLTLQRIIRCNPWSHGGIDRVPAAAPHSR